MASSSISIIVTLLAIISSVQIGCSQARTSSFFSKFIHITSNDGDVVKPKVSPAYAPLLAPAPAPGPSEEAVPVAAPAFAPEGFTWSGNPYGLYGQGGYNDEESSYEKENVNGATIDENKPVNVEFSNADERFQNGYQNNNEKYVGGYGYVNGRQGMSDTRFTQNYQVNNYENNKYTNKYKNSNGYTNRYENNNGYPNNYKNNNGYFANRYGNNGYGNEKQGLSDTRFLENGKYYYNVKDNENYHPTTTTTTTTTNEYGSTKNEEGYYGNNQNKYEFDSMEEYEKQMGYNQTPENYMP